MDKPVSLSVREYIIRKLSKKVMIPEKILDVVISHQFNEALDAIAKYNSVEISGFGKFYFNEKKAQTKLDSLLQQEMHLRRMLEDKSLTERKRKSTEYKLDALIKSINDLKPKIKNECKTNLRGLEEPCDASQGE